MKLSQRTLNILKNFSNINQGIVINPSTSKQELSTAAIGNKIVAFAKIDENFEVKVAWANLNRFLSAYNKSKDEVLVDFQQDLAVIKYGGKSQARLRYSNPETIHSLPAVLTDKEGKPRLDGNGNPITPKIGLQAKLGNPLVEFDISQKQLADLITMSGVLELPDMRVEPVNNKIMVRMYKERPEGIENVSTNLNNDTYEIEVGDWDGPNFAFDLDVSLLDVIPDDYKLRFSTSVVNFVSNTQELEYFIATRNTSKFGE